MSKVRIIREENLATESQLSEYEAKIGDKLPEEYRNFLLKYNGGIIFPTNPTVEADTDWDLWGLKRFLSIGDLKLQLDYQMHYNYKSVIAELDINKYEIDLSKLVTIAVAFRGLYHIYIGKEDFGRLYFSCYQDWDGLVRIKTKSFDEFLSSIKNIDESVLEIDLVTTKIQDRRFYYTPSNPELGLKRFDEVLAFIEDQEAPRGDYQYSIIEHYAYFTKSDEMGKKIFHHLLAKNLNLDRILLRCRDFDTIRYLINEYDLDFNKGFNGWYPIHRLTETAGWANVKENYELLDQLLNSKINVDLSILDPNGRTVKERLSNMIVVYEQYREYDKSNRPNEHSFLTSKAINEIL